MLRCGAIGCRTIPLLADWRQATQPPPGAQGTTAAPKWHACYATLGVESCEASEKKDKTFLKKAFRKKATVLHPDVAATGCEEKYRELKEAYDESVRRCGPVRHTNTDDGGRTPTDFYDHPHHHGDRTHPEGSQRTQHRSSADSSPHNTSGYNPTGHGDWSRRGPTTGFTYPQRKPGEQQTASLIIYRSMQVGGVLLFINVGGKMMQFNKEADELHAMHDRARITGTYAGTPWGRTDGQTFVNPVHPNDALSPREREEKKMDADRAASEKKNKGGDDYGMPDYQTMPNFKQAQAQAEDAKRARIPSGGGSIPGIQRAVGHTYHGYPFTPEGQAARRAAEKRKKKLKHMNDQIVNMKVMEHGKLSGDQTHTDVLGDDIVLKQREERQAREVLTQQKQVAKRLAAVAAWRGAVDDVEDDDDEEAQCAM